VCVSLPKLLFTHLQVSLAHLFFEVTKLIFGQSNQRDVVHHLSLH